MKKQHLFCIILFIVLWSLCAFTIQNDILIPYPKDVCFSLLNILNKKSTYISIAFTILRVFKGYIYSILISLLLACISFKYDSIRSFIEPIVVLVKTIPNISYIILAIIWLGSEGSVSAVTFMILFPICFNTFVSKLDELYRKQKDIIQIYQSDIFETIKICILPELYIDMIQTSITAISMGLKVAVMAEILAAVRIGVGKQLNYARINLNTSDLIAWTIIILILSYLLNYIFQLLLQRRLKEEQYGKSKCGDATNDTNNCRA